MGSVEAGCEGSWLPHPEEQLFLDQLYAFMDRQGSPIHKVPHLGFKKSKSLNSFNYLVPRNPRNTEWGLTGEGFFECEYFAVCLLLSSS